MKTSTKVATAIATLVGTVGIATAALADGWTTSVAGTWQGFGNQSAVTLNLSQPASALNCKPISGTYASPSTPTDRVSGFYCPTSGRITFARIRNGVTIQFYSGNLSQRLSFATTQRMAGIFAVVPNTAGGSPGEYNFNFTQSPVIIPLQ